MLDERTTEQRDLHGGQTPWLAGFRRPRREALTADLRCEVLIVGAGITGALAAEYLTRLGHGVVVVDRERPGYGSTAVSTAMLLWEIDRSLAELTDLYGFDRAASVYRRSLAVVRSMSDLIESMALPCGFARHDALYLAPAEAGEAGLANEHALRARAGLPGRFFGHATLREEFGLVRAAALLSPHSAEADPLRLTQALMQIAITRGARLFDAEALDYDCAGGLVGVQLSDGSSIEATHVVLATGYVMPDFLPSGLHRIVSSFALATPPQEAERLWRGGVLIWEASQDYLYARTTASGRIIAGGEDDTLAIEPDARDALMPAKAEAIQRRLLALWPKAAPVAEFIWSGAFGTTGDGLPLIGAVPGRPGLYAAYGYGGNGITFSYLAAQMIGELIAGRARPWFDDFAIDRDPPKAA